MKNHFFYLVKMTPDRFEFGITKNVKNRMNNYYTTGYGKAKLIGESTEACTESEARELEAKIKRFVSKRGVRGECCTVNEVDRVIWNIKTNYGFVYHNQVDVDMQGTTVYKVGDFITLEVTAPAIEDALSICSTKGSTSKCILAVSGLRQGLARPDVTDLNAKFSENGNRYTCAHTRQSMDTMMLFDEIISGRKDKSKLTPCTVKVKVTEVANIVKKKYVPRPNLSSGITKVQKKAKPRRTRGRDKGKVSYFKP